MRAFLKTKKHPDAVDIRVTREEAKRLEWEDENEFRYQGQMYDVIEKKIIGNQLVFHCVSDKKETALLQEYQKNTKRHSSTSIIFQLITAQFVLPNNYQLLQPVSMVQKYFTGYLFCLQNPVSTIVPPPPDNC